MWFVHLAGDVQGCAIRQGSVGLGMSAVRVGCAVAALQSMDSESERIEKN